MGTLNLKALAIACLRLGNQPGAPANGRRGDISRSLGREWRKSGVILYRLRVNLALAQLGVSPRLLSSSYRHFMQKTGHLFGNSPQEVALFMAAQSHKSQSPRVRRAVVNRWMQHGLIDPNAEPVRVAIAALDGKALRQ